MKLDIIDDDITYKKLIDFVSDNIDTTTHKELTNNELLFIGKEKSV